MHTGFLRLFVATIFNMFNDVFGYPHPSSEATRNFHHLNSPLVIEPRERVSVRSIEQHTRLLLRRQPCPIHLSGHLGDGVSSPTVWGALFVRTTYPPTQFNIFADATP